MPAPTKVGLDALLTPENCVLLLIDHQPFQLANVNSHDPTIVINNVTALAETAKAYGYDAFVVTDASGGVSPEAHDMAIRRLVAVGAQPTTWLALAGELQRDWVRTERLGEVAQLFIDHAGATGSVFLWETQLLAASQGKGA